MKPLKPFQKQILNDILKALNKKCKFWAIVVVGFDDHKWEYAVTEVFAHHEEIEIEAIKNIRLFLENNEVYPAFVKLKSFTSDINYIKKFEDEQPVLIKCY